MSRPRPRAIRKRLVLTLTHAQFRALAGAVDRAGVELAEDNRTTEVQTLDRAWAAIKAAWYAGART